MDKIFCTRIRRIPLFWVYFVCLVGCRSDGPVLTVDDYVLKSGDIVVSAADFSEELELARAAYPYGIHTDHDAFNALVMRVVDQLSEEIVLRREASTRGITITEADIDSAEQTFRRDYPDRTFEAMLLDNAVSYAFWRKRLGIRLLIDTFIEKQIDGAIEITAEEIARYYDEYIQQFQTQDVDEKAQGRINEKDLVAHLRKKKAEAVYPGLIKKLGEIYPIEINRQTLSVYLK